MRQLVIKPAAIKMARDAYYWYEKQQIGLGEAFLNEVNRCYNKIEKQPALYAKINENFRHIILRRFPYVIIFEVIDEEIVIYAVFNTSRNPDKKFSK